MRYSFLLLPHANIRYREALAQLSCCEINQMVQSMGLPAVFETEEIGGCTFLSAELSDWDEHLLRVLSHHSSLYLFCRRDGAALYPVERPRVDYLPGDLPEILKYKGKTSVPFTLLMINCARSVAGLWGTPTRQLTVLDPMCGRGTTLFTALQKGYHTIGLDSYRTSVQEADQFLSRYLKYHRLKHSRACSSRTVHGKGYDEIRYTLADTKEHYTSGDTRTACMYAADASLAGALAGKARPQLLVCDLPYGVQHDPTLHGKPEPVESMLRRCLPEWFHALAPGGAGALSFNQFTLSRNKLETLVENAGFVPYVCDPQSFVHPVEQAVTRDLVLFTRP